MDRYLNDLNSYILQIISAIKRCVNSNSLNEGLSPRLFASKTTMIIVLCCFVVIVLVIIVGGIIGYFSNYFKTKTSFYEEESQNIEMSKKI